MMGQVEVLWHADPTVGDPDDDYTAAVVKALSDEGKLALAGVVVNRQPVRERAEQFASTLAALGVTRDGRPVPVGTGAGDIGRPMPPMVAGAPEADAPRLVDGRALQLTLLDAAAPGSLVVLVTTAATDLDWLLEQDGAREKVGAVVMMGDAVPGAPWEPGDAVNNLVDQVAARRVFERLQRPEWGHVRFTVVSRWAAMAGGTVTPPQLDWLAESSAVAGWLRDRAAASMNERWTSFATGAVPGRSRATFVDNHLGGRDPERAAHDPVFDLVTEVPLYAALVPLAAFEPEWFWPTVDPSAPNVWVIGHDRVEHGVWDTRGLRWRLVGLLSDGFGRTG